MGNLVMEPRPGDIPRLTRRDFIRDIPPVLYQGTICRLKISTCEWDEIYKELPKPQLRFVCQTQTDDEYLMWINCHNETVRSILYLWLYELISLEPEIRRAVAEAKSFKGVSSSDHPGASHQPFRYHADNACYRIFAALDKVGQLLNMYLSLEVPQRKVAFKKVIDVISKSPDLNNIPELLPLIRIRDLEWYNSLSEYRHSLTHRLSPVCENQESYRELLKAVSKFLEFKPIGYTLDQLDNLISDGHKHFITIIEQCEELLNKVPCRV